MIIFERIKILAKRKHVTLQEISHTLGFGQSTLYKWKKQSPNVEFLAKVADYFQVSVDYLLGRETEIKMTEKKDLKRFLTKNLNHGITYDGNYLTKEDRERLKFALTQVFWKYEHREH